MWVAMSVEELTRLLQEAEQRAEAAEKERQEERQRAEGEQQRAEEAEERAEASEQRAEASEQQTQPTTLDEYIAACHSLIFSSFTIELNPKLTSKGPITNPRNKCVEDPVKTIINQLKEIEEIRIAFHLGNGIIFENHPHIISNMAEEVVDRDTSSTPPSTPNHRLNLNQLRPDQISIYRSDHAGSTRRTIIYISEYKPPHKLTALHLRLGLRPMNIYKDVTWIEDFEITRRSIPEDERYAPKSSPGYQPEAYEGINRSPYLLRGKRRRRVGDKPVKEQAQTDPGESSDDESARDLPDTPGPTERRTRRGGSESQGGQATRRSQRTLAQRPRGGGGGGRGVSNDNEQDRPYCTQKCLLGLVKGGVLDPRCPNMSLHSRQPNNHRSHYRGPSRACARHPIDHAKFLELLWEQLERSLDDGITPLGQGGARGVLFKVALPAYGYTFVSKGTVRAFAKDLEHEAAVYERLQPIQGFITMTTESM
ncbi:EKC/KEOPS complex subunit BUD32 [Fusarium sp. LHS14.1]|nr:EKC/KEOPS complex subunit BUD32 [Fusarium sp. LHS14.1]